MATMRRCTGPLLLMVNLVFTVVVAHTPNVRCRKTPSGITSPPSDPDGRFLIEVLGNPNTYVPGDKYTVYLRGVHSGNTQAKFSNFLLVAEHKTQDGEFFEDRDSSVGYFQIAGDPRTVFNDYCPNSISETNSLQKPDIQVTWTAPPKGSGCVLIKATVVESSQKWYNEGGFLTKELCEEERESDDAQPKPVENCCACDEAKYEVAFEGLWSRNTHPKDFPDNKWLTKFSDIIGASHTINYRFWDYGQMASEGLKDLAEKGNTKALESELKGKSDQIRTIIKARGISHPNTTARTFAVFRVDNRHHLMSLVSMIQPSPDWIVGVSGLELCLENCSWIDSKIFNLYPWDAGTDDGVSYASKDRPSYPRQPIRSLKNENTSESPFYDEHSSPLKPLARLILTRQRLYEKHCDTDQMRRQQNYCEVTDWGEWTCNAPCGTGMRLRQRAYKYKDPDYSKQQMECKQTLTERSSCFGKRICPKEVDYAPEGCELTEWGQFSSCSATCGNGTSTRSRRYKNRNAAKICRVTSNETPPPLEQNMSCEEPCEDDEQIAEIEPYCTNRRWSEWSPCSSSCGKGFKVRVKLASPEPERNEENEEDPCAYLEEKVECYNDDMPTCEDSQELDAFSDVDAHFSGTATGDGNISSENQVKDGEPVDCILSEWSKWSACDCNTGKRYKRRYEKQPAMNGGKPCKRLKRSKSCGPGDMKRCRHGEFDENDEEDVDCELSKWTDWSPCSQSCGHEAVQQRSRMVKRAPRGNGRKCGTRFEQRKCFLNACLDFFL